MTSPPARRALISVFRKEGIVELCRQLTGLGFEIISTGGTARHLASSGVPVTPVEDVTGFSEMLDGRVKTLHPLLHGALLLRRDLAGHQEEARRHGIQPIDLVAVNLYPFAEIAGKADASAQEKVEMIDIGGPAMVRAAAKNHAWVTVLMDPEDYPAVLAELRERGETTLETRRRLAVRAFQLCSVYDSTVAAHLSRSLAAGGGHPEWFLPAYHRRSSLRYGENPHQAASLYTEAHPPAGSVVSAAVLQGKELSFNNYLDLDFAWVMAAGFEQPAAAVVKHNNPCGVATEATLVEAYTAAREADPVSAFGGIVGVNRVVDQETARAMVSTFLEAVYAPGYEPVAREIFSTKKNLRLLDSRGVPPGAAPAGFDFKKIAGGLLLQAPDVEPGTASWRTVTRREPTPEERAALVFAWKVAHHVRSNAIVYATAHRTLGIGAGQMSRVDAARLGAMKARSSLKGSALASDAFFPFRDAVDQAAAQGVTAMVQPGGSIRDEEVIAAADEGDIAMVFTGVRHFRH